MVYEKADTLQMSYYNYRGKDQWLEGLNKVSDLHSTIVAKSLMINKSISHVGRNTPEVAS